MAKIPQIVVNLIAIKLCSRPGHQPSFSLRNSLAAEIVWALRALSFKNPLRVWSHAGQPLKSAQAVNFSRGLLGIMSGEARVVGHFQKGGPSLLCFGLASS
jgi:hypothetical protein